MNAVIRWTLYLRRISIVSWSIGAFLLMFLNLIFYPSFREDAGELQKSFENLPESAIQLFGGSADFFSPVGYLNSQVFYLMLPLILGILAIALGSSLLAREEQDTTIESLLSRPIKRSTLLSAKAVAGVIVLTIVTVISLLTTLIIGRMVDLEVATFNIVMATISCFLLVLSLGAIAFTLTATGKARGASIGIATLIGLGGYIVSSLAGTVDWLKLPSKVFPFHYYRSEDLLRGSIDLKNMLFFVGIVVACCIISWVAFRRRDIA
jgi:ABC-2 type transport system permease protein